MLKCKDCFADFFTQHNLQSNLSLQIHRRSSVRVLRPPAPILLLAELPLLARGRSATRRATYLRSATTSLQGRENSKANTYVMRTIKIRRWVACWCCLYTYNTFQTIADDKEHCAMNILAYSAPLWIDKCCVCHINNDCWFYSAQVLEKRNPLP